MPLLIFLFCWIVLEIYVFILVGDEIGWLLAIGLLIAGMVIGSAIIKKQNNDVNKMMMNAQQGMRTKPVNSNTILINILAGFLFLIPGFVSDILAILLMIPFIRKGLAFLLLKAFKPDIVTAKFGFQHMQSNAYEPKEDIHTYARKEDGSVIKGEFISKEDPKK